MLPYLLHGVGADGEENQVSPEYRAASYMILVQLCSLATLAQDFLEGIRSFEKKLQLYVQMMKLLWANALLWGYDRIILLILAQLFMRVDRKSKCRVSFKTLGDQESTQRGSGTLAFLFFTISLHAVLIQQLARNARESDLQQVVMVLIHLAATQPQLKALPKSALKVELMSISV